MDSLSALSSPCLPLRDSVIRIQQDVERHPRLVLAGSTMEE
jgi:hypothetical protein